MNEIDPLSLTSMAFAILIADLEGHGNVLNDWHRAALQELVTTLTDYATGKAHGRVAFPLPTGTGKTSAVVAFLTALHRLGHEVPVSVAASKVEALCSMKSELLAHGVPEQWIGLKHSLPNASLPTTGNESRLFQLVTHARVRGGGVEEDFALFGTYRGTPRSLLVYDETFMRSDAFALRARSLSSAVLALGNETRGSRHDHALHALLTYLQDAVGRIDAALDDLQHRGDPECRGAVVRLGFLAPGEVKAMQTLVGTYRGRLRGFEGDLQDLLACSQDTLCVVGSEQGEGIVTSREVIPLALRNVMVLDASAPIRELARMDPSVRVIESFDPALLKDYSTVDVRQVLSPGGRSTMAQSFAFDRREASAVSREVAHVIREGWATEQAFLVFTFTRRDRFDMAADLQRDLRILGIDIDARTAPDDKNPAGLPRINWLTWGSETSLNGLEHCTSVIMAGVLHRSHLDLSASVRGQTGNPAEATPSHRIRDLVESEIAHCIYQGASRGSCRRIVNGKAAPMRLWFIHRSSAIKSMLDKVMPGASWTYPDPRYLKKAAVDTKAEILLGPLLGHLRGLSGEVIKVSSRKVKAAMALPKDKATEHAFTRAVGLLDLEQHGWTSDGRSLVRDGAVHGFSIN